MAAWRTSRLLRVYAAMACLSVSFQPAEADDGAGAGDTPPRVLTMADRVAAAKAIEEVYWRHRIWPADNPKPKPSLEEILPPGFLEHRVDDYLRLSTALERQWSHSVTARDLEAELRRMVRDSRNPTMLRELFAALNNDPRLLLEALARPVLVSRLAQNWYAMDERFHGATEHQARGALARVTGPSQFAQIGGDYDVTEWRLREDPAATDEPSVAGRSARYVGQEDWEEVLSWLARDLGDSQLAGTDPAQVLEDLPVHQLSPLINERSQYRALMILEKGTGLVRVAQVHWKKRSFEDWWAESKAGFTPSASAPGLDELRAPIGPESQTPCEFDQWTPLPSVPDARTQHATVWTGAEMLVWGGWGKTYLRSGALYDPATDTWRPTNLNNAPEARYDHSMVWTGTEAIVWGGYSNVGYEQTGGRYNPIDGQWTATTMVGVPDNRSRHTAVWTGTEMLVWGGMPYRQFGGRYDPSANAWRPMSADGSPDPRVGHQAVWTGSEMLVVGGRRPDSTYPAGSGGMYDPATDHWRYISDTYRYKSAAVWTGTEVLVWGGGWWDGTKWRLDSISNPLLRYDSATNNWHPLSAGGCPNVTYGPAVVWTGSELLTFGGSTEYNSNYSQSSAAGRYDRTRDLWLPVSPIDRPFARQDHTAVWTGTEMIVWGGYSSSTSLATGARYHPPSDTWLPTSTDSPPLARSRHTAVWTGSEMIIWGGVGGGARFSPALNSWEPTRGDPMYYSAHTAVWTGREMVVWGGEDDAGIRTQSGARYDPLFDSWSDTAQLGAPSARAYHTAVWTGNDMIIWGGSSDRLLQTGARYSPLNDQWFPITAVGAPTARAYHTAIWSGSEMVIWGGDTTTPSGGRYSPTLDRWLPTSLVDAPEARRRHTAVWTGAEMIVWGGAGGVSPLSTGGRYSPILDAWVATPTVGAPAPRSSHSAVYFPDAMAVWGGFNGMQRVASGARYHPATDRWVPLGASWTEPRSRDGHTAVWTGDQMIVWGGYGIDDFDRLNYLNNGSSHCTCSGGADADCNGLDEDCDGIPDDGFVAQSTTCGIGACASTGWISCFEGMPTDTCMPGVPALDDSLCNAVDDDCDGTIDEEFVTESTACGVGACAATGTNSCIAGLVTDSCVSGEPAPSDASCDAVDDDCDGTTDEHYSARSTSCGVGACASTGVTACEGGSETDSCSPGAPGATDSSCNGVDENCNGLADEEFAPTPTSCGVGACASTGSTSCVGGGIQDSCQPGAPAPNDADCDGIDDDCDGSVDEDYAPRTTSCGIGACQRSGSTVCAGGAETDSCTPGAPAPNDALCNGIDDDCNGVQDEDFVSQPITCGVGACLRNGSTQCVGGQLRTDCTPGVPAPNDPTCDGVDDDCDGVSDEDGNCLNTYLDADGDGYGDPATGAVFCCAIPPGRVSDGTDCNDADPNAWAVPGEVPGLTVLHDRVIWEQPAQPGGSVDRLRYDTLRSGDPLEFVAGAVCLDSGGSDLESPDAEAPSAGALFAYLVRALSACPTGTGSLGASNSGTERAGRDCP